MHLYSRYIRTYIYIYIYIYIDETYIYIHIYTDMKSGFNYISSPHLWGL